jgi:hypothetical protein
VDDDLTKIISQTVLFQQLNNKILSLQKNWAPKVGDTH